MPRSDRSRSLFLFVLGAILAVYAIGSLWLERPVADAPSAPETTEAGLAPSVPAASSAAAGAD